MSRYSKSFIFFRVLTLPFFYVQELLQKVLDFQSKVRDAQREERPRSQPLKDLLEEGMSLDVDVTEMTSLRELVKQAQWLDDVEAVLEGEEQSLRQCYTT